ncbi:hypothetical protein ACFCWG_05370 [Streptomyces sp. NPDC056390]
MRGEAARRLLFAAVLMIFGGLMMPFQGIAAPAKDDVGDTRERSQV